MPLAGADVVVTGEGYLDEQSFEGKVVGGVCELAAAAGCRSRDRRRHPTTWPTATRAACDLARRPLRRATAFDEPRWCMEPAGGSGAVVVVVAGGRVTTVVLRGPPGAGDRRASCPAASLPSMTRARSPSRPAHRGGGRRRRLHVPRRRGRRSTGPRPAPRHRRRRSRRPIRQAGSPRRSRLAHLVAVRRQGRGHRAR